MDFVRFEIPLKLDIFDRNTLHVYTYPYTMHIGRIKIYRDDYQPLTK